MPASPWVRVLAAHLFAWAVFQARMKRFVSSDEPWSLVERDRMIRWGLYLAS